MKQYIIFVIIGIFFLSGCNNKKSMQDTGSSDTTVMTPLTPIEETTTTDTDSTDSTTSTEDNVTQAILRKEIAPETNAKEWYIRIVVEDTTNNLKSTSAQIGQIDADNTLQDYALKAISPFSAPYLDVLFVNPVGLDTGSYKSEFHLSSTNEDTWEFTVKSSDTSATMILSWRGLYVLNSYYDSEGRKRYHEYRSLSNPLLKFMTITDVSTGMEINVLDNGAVNPYVFNMDGQTERVFQWKVKDSSVVVSAKRTAYGRVVSPSTVKQEMKALEVKALRKDAKATPEKLRQKRLKSVDMHQPPTFKVLQ